MAVEIPGIDGPQQDIDNRTKALWARYISLNKLGITPEEESRPDSPLIIDLNKITQTNEHPIMGEFSISAYDAFGDRSRVEVAFNSELQGGQREVYITYSGVVYDSATEIEGTYEDYEAVATLMGVPTPDEIERNEDLYLAA